MKHACLAVRLLIAAAAFWVRDSPKALRVAGIAALFPATGFSAIWALKLRRTGIEVQSPDKVVWWDHLRPLHAATYFAFAYLAAVAGSPHAYSALLFDAGVGAGAFAMRRKPSK